VAKKRAVSSATLGDAVTPLPTGRLRLRKDPASFATEHPVPDGVFVRVIGLDLGTKCGFAVCDLQKDKPLDGQLIVAGIWDLSVGPFDSGALRHLRLRQFLAVTKPDFISFENVKYTPPAEQFKGRLSPAAIVARAATSQEFLGGLKMTVLSWAEANGVPTQPQDIGTIKKYATGKGVASKLDMVRAANTKYGMNLVDSSEEEARAVGDDNVADAVFCCSLGIDMYKEGLAEYTQR